VGGRRALLVVHGGKPEAAEGAERVREAIRAHGVLVGEVDIDSFEGEAARDAEVVVALGGDGTLLSLARSLGDVDRPLLGVNFGRVGFLAEFDLETFVGRAGAMLGEGGTLPITDRPMIDVEVADAGGAVRETGTALNDAVVTAGPPYRMIELALRIGGEDGPTARGDGVIVATPFGSTAYNASAGGPIIVPGVDALAVTPIAAHSLSFRPIVAPKSAGVEIRMVRVNREEGAAEGAWGGTALVLDGQVAIGLEQGELVRVRLSERRRALVRNPAWSYWRTLMQKLHWAAAPTNVDRNGC